MRTVSILSGTDVHSGRTSLRENGRKAKGKGKAEVWGLDTWVLGLLTAPCMTPKKLISPSLIFFIYNIEGFKKQVYFLDLLQEQIMYAGMLFALKWLLLWLTWTDVRCKNSANATHCQLWTKSTLWGTWARARNLIRETGILPKEENRDEY